MLAHVHRQPALPALRGIPRAHRGVLGIFRGAARER